MRRFYIISSLILISLQIHAQYIAKSQAVADIDFYDKTLREVHYNPFLYVSEAQYLKKIDSLKNNLPDSIEIRPFTLKMGELTSVIKDGHTTPSLIQSAFQVDFRKKIFFPFSFVADKKSNVYALTSFQGTEIPKGAQIISINGTDLSQFYKKGATLIGGIEAYRQELAIKLLGYNLYLSGIKPPFNVEYIYNKQKQQKTIAEGTILKDLLGNAFPSILGKSYTFKIIENKVGYIDLISMGSNYKIFNKFFDSCFSEIRTKKVNTVAIDLRKNTGGNSIIADLLISYFNKDKYILSAAKYWKISDTYKKSIIANGDTSSTYLKKNSNTIWEFINCDAKDPMFITDTVFNGKVFIITGPMTFSSANMLADGVKTFKMATLIGEPTGENTSDFGEVYRFNLPNSKIMMQVTTSFDLGADCKDKTKHPVIPDKLIKTTYLDQINGIDPVINYLLKQ
ncbi:S41 family peptidase [Pedobacter nototheniae]|uniref:S41 family peptidase n=1 Tax=Pedobacter nototheniae TaxID=2488994 RepID=UPI00103C8AF9|nr:S41 family peptidase [Pedobacter nototheniae]